MRKKIFCLAFGALQLAFSFPVGAQQAPKLPQIGVLSLGFSGVSSPQLEGFRQGLRELGYTEGKTIVIDYRFAEAKLDRLTDLAAELVRLKVDVHLGLGGHAGDPRRQESLQHNSHRLSGGGRSRGFGVSGQPGAARRKPHGVYDHDPRAKR